MNPETENTQPTNASGPRPPTASDYHDDQQAAKLREGLVELGIDVGEVVVDSMMKDGILRDFPVIGAAVGFFRIGRTIHDIFLVTKISRFMDGAKLVNEAERQDFCRRLREEKDFAKRVEEQVVVYLDRYEHISKAKVLGLIFKALARKRIDEEQFQRLAYHVDRCFAPDLLKLSDYSKAGASGLVASPSTLHMTGLIDPVPTFDMNSGNGPYRITELGKLLHSILNESDDSRDLASLKGDK
jgi:hypothetical protein